MPMHCIVKELCQQYKDGLITARELQLKVVAELTKTEVPDDQYSDLAWEHFATLICQPRVCAETD